MRYYVYWIKILATNSWVIILLSTVTVFAQEQTSTQLWGSLILGYAKSERVYLEVEIQPKKQISGGETWRNLYATWLIAYYPNKWFDLTGELLTDYTNQNPDLDSFELTPRAGIRLHLVEQVNKERAHRGKLRPERMPADRFHLATWLRLEQRHIFYSGDLESSHELRFRVRPEFKVAINNKSLGDDNTLYFSTDVEIYVPITDDVPERFVNSVRFRAGLGYRINYDWRVELLYLRDVFRESPLGSFEENANVLDLRLKFLF
jgi:hypothetical protein